MKNTEFIYAKYKALLQKFTLFRDVEERDIPRCLELLQAKEKSYRKKETLVQLGSVFSHAGIVLEGVLEVVFLNASYDRLSINRFEKGDLYGESLAILRMQESPLQVSAVTDCSVLLLDFHKLLYDGSEAEPLRHVLLRNLLLDTTKQNLFLNKKVRMLSQKKLRDRIRIYLRELAVTGRDANTMHLQFSVTGLAEFLAVDRSALSRELGRMQDEQLIKMEGNTVTVLEKELIAD